MPRGISHIGTYLHLVDTVSKRLQGLQSLNAGGTSRSAFSSADEIPGTVDLCLRNMCEMLLLNVSLP